MKSALAILTLLAGWYLMAPPPNITSNAPFLCRNSADSPLRPRPGVWDETKAKPGDGLPLWKWDVWAVFDTKERCEAAAERERNLTATYPK